MSSRAVTARRTADAQALLTVAVTALPGGTVRTGQIAMTDAISEAVRSGEHLLVQAGTGTGKSLGYLVPALASGRRTVVSTATLALQAQLVDVDLPRLADAATPVLGRRPRFALLKGRHHYVCLAKLTGGEDAARDDQDELVWVGRTSRLEQQIVRVREWAETTETGDRTELDPGVDEVAWRAVSMPARECIGASRCQFGEECFAEAARATAREADIVVTNHSLLAIDLTAERRILPDHDLLIVDEAHELVDRMTSASQAELTPETVVWASRRLGRQADAGLRDRLADAGEGLRAALAPAVPQRLVELPESLHDALVLLSGAARDTAVDLGEISSDDPSAVGKQQAKAALLQLTETAQRLLAESPADVIWIAEDEHGRHKIVVAPLSVAGALGSRLFTGRTVIATSATLALGGRFDIVARSIGLRPEFGRTPATGDTRVADTETETGNAATATTTTTDSSAQPDGRDAEPDDADTPVPFWRALDVGSPFDYPRQGILYVAARLPRPQASGLSDGAAAELVDLVTAAGGRTLGLFSSRKAAGQAAEVLRDRTDLPILLQGEEMLGHLVRQFRAEPKTCLLGVMSLWQGVDVPGASCQLVVVDRLPFPRPDEPLPAARAKAVDDTGGSGFASVSVPIAAVRLAQGAGRLIRSAADRGVVAVLDSRLHTARSYGEFMRRSLPPFWYTTAPDVVRGALRRLDGSTT